MVDLGGGYDVGEGLEGLWVSERFSEVCIDVCFDSVHLYWSWWMGIK